MANQNQSEDQKDPAYQGEPDKEHIQQINDLSAKGDSERSVEAIEDLKKEYPTYQPDKSE